MRRNEVWWAELKSKTRPVLLVSRDSHIKTRDLILAVPLTTRERGLVTQIPLGPEDGLPKACVADAGTLLLVHKSQLSRFIVTLSSRKTADVNAALSYALGLD